MAKFSSSIVIAAFAVFCLTSCEEESSPLFDQQSFTKIYDNNFFTEAYYPLDLKQTPDGGFLIVGSKKVKDSNFSGIYILKVDKTGEFVKSLDDIDPVNSNPIAQLMESNGSYYFFCMNATTLESQLAKVDANAEAVEFMTVSGGDDLHSYPAASAQDGSNFILLNYDHENKASVLSVVNASGEILGEDLPFSIGVGDEVEEPIINHFFQTGRKFPFQVGRIPGGLYYFNGFYNYTISLVFTDLNSEDPIGTVQGQQDDGGFSAVQSLGGAKFAASRFNFGDNFLLPNVTLSSSGTTSSTDLGGNTLPELVSNAKVKILRTTIKQKSILIFASDTKSRQIGLLFYDESNGNFYGTQYLGFSNPFELSGLTQTSDEGLAVCGTTYVAGRFPRACLFKLSKDELAKNIN
jgi:hypothetical protein